MRSGGQETVIRGMPAIDIRMRDAAEDREVPTMVLEHFKVRRERIVLSALLGKKIIGEQTEVVADSQYTARRAAWCGCCGFFRDGRKRRHHGIEQRQGKRNARTPKERAPGEGAPGGNEWSSVCHKPSCCCREWTAQTGGLFRKN